MSGGTLDYRAMDKIERLPALKGDEGALSPLLAAGSFSVEVAEAVVSIVLEERLLWGMLMPCLATGTLWPTTAAHDSIETSLDSAISIDTFLVSHPVISIWSETSEPCDASDLAEAPF